MSAAPFFFGPVAKNTSAGRRVPECVTPCPHAHAGSEEATKQDPLPISPLPLETKQTIAVAMPDARCCRWVPTSGWKRPELDARPQVEVVHSWVLTKSLTWIISMCAWLAD